MVRTLETGDDEGFFGPGSAVWEVHSGIPTVVAGIRALLMQTLHPGAMAGVHDHSGYREDPLGRLAGTVRWVLTTTFADRAQATAACRWVTQLHSRVHGTYPGADGRPLPTPPLTPTSSAGCTASSPTPSSAATRRGAARFREAPISTCASGRALAS